MYSSREKVLKYVKNLNIQKFTRIFKNFDNFLIYLKDYNLLCENEVSYYYKNNYFQNYEETELLEIIKQRVIFHQEEENKILNSEFQQGGLIQVFNGSRIQGTVHVGGLQPNYIIDTQSTEIQNFLKVIKNETSNLSVDEKIDKVGNIVRNFIDRTEYNDTLYLELLKKYKNKGIEIPLSEYLKIKRGVCREISLLTVIALNSIDIESYYYYAKVSTNFGYEKEEDHAVVLVNINNKKIIIDNYFKSFNKKNFDDLQLDDGIITESGLMYDNNKSLKGTAKIIQSRLYPKNNNNPKYKK